MKLLLLLLFPWSSKYCTVPVRSCRFPAAFADPGPMTLPHRAPCGKKSSIIVAVTSRGSPFIVQSAACLICLWGSVHMSSYGMKLGDVIIVGTWIVERKSLSSDMVRKSHVRYGTGSGFIPPPGLRYLFKHRLSTMSKPWHAALYNNWVIRRKRKKGTILFFYTLYNIGYPNIQKPKNRHRTYTPSPNITANPTTPAIA